MLRRWFELLFMNGALWREPTRLLLLRTPITTPNFRIMSDKDPPNERYRASARRDFNMTRRYAGAMDSEIAV